MSLLVPDTGLLFWMTLSFGVVLFVLARYAFPTILRAIDNRSKHIENALQDAEAAEKRLAEVGQEAAAIIEQANAQRAAMLNEARQLSTAALDQARRDAEKETAARLERARAEAEELRRRTISDAIGQIAALSVKIAGKVVDEELHQDEKQKKLVERFLSREKNA